MTTFVLIGQLKKTPQAQSRAESLPGQTNTLNATNH